MSSPSGQADPCPDLPQHFIDPRRIDQLTRERKAKARSKATPAAEPAGETRRFELSDGASAKFWEITVTGSAFAVRFGKIGTNGQTQVKSFATEREAASAACRR